MLLILKRLIYFLIMKKGIDMSVKYSSQENALILSKKEPIRKVGQELSGINRIVLGSLFSHYFEVLFENMFYGESNDDIEDIKQQIDSYQCDSDEFSCESMIYVIYFFVEYICEYDNAPHIVKTLCRFEGESFFHKVNDINTMGNLKAYLILNSNIESLQIEYSDIMEFSCRLTNEHINLISNAFDVELSQFTGNEDD